MIYAELHLHLEGTIQPETLVELSRRHDAEPLDVERVRDLYRYKDFQGFMMAFKAVTERLRTADDFQLITYEMMRGLAAQSVVHAEVFVSVGVVHHWKRQDFDELFEGLESGRERGEKDFGVSVFWIFDAARQFGAAAAMRVAEAAVKLRHRRVVALGLGGDEIKGPAEMFRDVYAYAAANGLHRSCHAGETAGSESVRRALDDLHAERIGHGLRAIEDPALMARLVREQIPVEVCVTSNLRTGCCATVEDHPLRKLFDAGVMVTLASDDPAMFGTSLAQEYQLARDAFGFSEAEIRQLAMNSFRASFLPEEEKTRHLKALTAGR